MSNTKSQKIQLHPDACKAFNERIADVRSHVRSRPPAKGQHRSIDPDLHVTAHLTDKDIVGSMTMGFIDSLGRPLESWVLADGLQVGLEGEPFQFYLAFCRELQGRKEFKQRVSVNFIEERTFEWLTDPVLSQQTYSTFIQRRANEAQQTASYWVPIAHLRIASPFRIGHVVFKRITKQMLDSFPEAQEPMTDEERAAVEVFVRRQRGRLQGYTAGAITIEAELERGRELAFEKVELALSMLRFVEPGSVDPLQTSYVVPLGQDTAWSRTVFTMKDGVPSDWAEGLISKRSMDSTFSPDFIKELPSFGLDTLSSILQKVRWTNYETKLVESLLVYSRVSISERLSDKLVYALVALESLFLRNQSEPIQKNLGERIAFLIGKDLNARKAIVTLISDIYGVRSALLHHGQHVSDDEKIKQFLYVAWSALHNVISRSTDYSDITDLLSELDDRKLS